MRRAQPQDDQEGGDERERVGEDGPARAEPDVERRGQRGSCHEGEAHRHLLQAAGARPLSFRDDVADESEAGGVEELPAHRRQYDHGVDGAEPPRDGRRGDAGDGRQEQEQERAQGVGPQQCAALVPAVDEDARERADEDGGHGAGDEHAARGQGRPGLAVPEPGRDPQDEGGVEEPVAQVGDRLAGPEQGEVAVGEQARRAYRRVGYCCGSMHMSSSVLLLCVMEWREGRGSPARGPLQRSVRHPFVDILVQVGVTPPPSCARARRAPRARPGARRGGGSGPPRGPRGRRGCRRRRRRRPRR